MEYESETEGIRVSVRPRFSLAQSDPGEGTYVFSYEIELENASTEPAQLMFRHWRIHDSGGEDTVVDGDGVVGEQPVLTPGESHHYSSFCVLRSPVGWMEGYYTFTRPFTRSEDDEFEVAIPRFDLEAPLPPPEAPERPEATN